MFVRIAAAVSVYSIAFQGRSEAQSSPYKKSLASYFEAKFGELPSDTARIVVTHVAATSACPADHRCPGGIVALVSFAQGDGAGQGLMFSSTKSMCSSCLKTVIAGGGVIGRNGLRAYGLTVAQIKYLVTH